MYPLALGVEQSENGWKFIYGLPELPSAEGQEKEETGNSALAITGVDFETIEKYMTVHRKNIWTWDICRC